MIQNSRGIVSRIIVIFNIATISMFSIARLLVLVACVFTVLIMVTPTSVIWRQVDVLCPLTCLCGMGSRRVMSPRSQRFAGFRV